MLLKQSVVYHPSQLALRHPFLDHMGFPPDVDIRRGLCRLACELGCTTACRLQVDLVQDIGFLHDTCELMPIIVSTCISA